MKKILIALSQFGGYDGDPLPAMKNKGYEIIMNPHGRKLTADEVVSLARDVDGILAGLEPLNREVLEKLPNLRAISRAGIGVDNVDLSFAKEKNIQVLITPDAIKQSVVELTLGVIWAVLRKIPQADALIREGKWTRLKGTQLLGKTVGVVGLGRIGRGVAESLRALGINVIGTDVQPDENWAKKTNVSIVSFEENLKRADIVSLHVPSLGGKELIGAKEIAQMKSGAVLVNMARGGLVNEAALLVALENQKLGGAALDVFEKEPYSGPLSKLDNVVLTAHMGSHTAEARRQMEIDAANQLVSALEGGASA